MRSLRCLLGVLVPLVAVVLPAQQEAEVEGLLDKAKQQLRTDPDAARRDLRAAWDLIQRIDKDARHEQGFAWRWKCGAFSWGLDLELGEQAWRSVLPYYDPKDEEQLKGLQNARNQLAAVLTERRKHDDAIQLRRTIVADWQKAGDALQTALARAELGQALVLGGLDSGLEGLAELDMAYQSLVASHPDSRDLAWIAQIYATALVDMGQGLDPRVLDLLLSALDYWKRHPPEDTDGKLASIRLLYETANSYQTHCRMLEARAMALAALEAAEAHHGKQDPATFWPRGLYAATLKRMGEFETARQLNLDNKECAAKLPKFDERRRRAWSGLGHTLLLMGQHSQEGSPQRRQYLEAAVDALEKSLTEGDPNAMTPLDVATAATNYDNLGTCYSHLGRNAEALALLTKALAAQKIELPRAQTEGGLAMALQDAGRFAEAADHFEQAVPVVIQRAGGYRQPIYYLRRQALTLSALGEGKRLQTVLENLLEVGRSALKECHTLPGRPSFELATVADSAAMQVLALAKETPAKAKLEEGAFELLESLRGISERMTSLSKRLEKVPGAEEQLKKSRAARQAFAKKASLGKGESPELFELARTRDESEFKALVEMLGKAKLPVVEVTVAAIAQKLPANAAVVAFRVVTLVTFDKDKKREVPTERLEAHLVTRDKDGKGRFLRVDLKDPAPMRQAAEKWLQEILAGEARGRPGETRQKVDAAAELDTFVLKPLEKTLTDAKAKVLIVCLDDDLHRVPFELLPTVKRLALEARFTSSLVDLLVPAAGPLKEPSLFVAGGIDFDREPGAPGPAPVATSRQGQAVDGAHRAPAPTWGGTAGVKDLQFEELKATQEEAEKIAEAFAKKFGKEATRKTGREVSHALCTAEAQQVRYLHIATHGYVLDPIADIEKASARDQTVRGFAPMSICGLALTGANLMGTKGHEDHAGALTGEEIAGMDLSGCEIAVLSACSTYLGVKRAGQGLASLQGAMHAAGARIVITSRWKVPDRATKELMVQFYNRIWGVKGETPRQALERAKAEVAKTMKDPVNWAGFVLTGDLADPPAKAGR